MKSCKWPPTLNNYEKRSTAPCQNNKAAEMVENFDHAAKNDKF